MRIRLLYLFLLVSLLESAQVPDTTKIPARWKNESIIVLSHNYEAIEAFSGECEEKFKFVYYIKDKFALKQLSTLNIPNEVKKSGEIDIGKIYKKNNNIIPITTKHLTERSIKIGKGTKNGANNAVDYETSQKLAIPSLEVGDILEIKYTSKRRSMPNVIYISPKYPTLHMEIYASIREDNIMYSNYSTEISYKAINYEQEKVTSTNRTISVLRDSVEKIKDEILTDNNKLYPYLIIWKKHNYFSDESSSTLKFSEAKEETLEKKQLKIARGIYEKGDYDQKSIAKKISKYLNKKYKLVNDTVAYLNEAFFYYRELVALGSILGDGENEYYFKGDRFFVNVISRVLFEKKVPYDIFLTQADYYGEPVSENDIMKPQYGIYVATKNYYMFNPNVYSLPNQIPSYFENQSFLKFKTNKHYKPYKYARGLIGLVFFPINLPPFIVRAVRAKKYRQFGFSFARFPISEPDENLTKADITIDKFDFKNQTCNFNLEFSYFGKNKNRIQKSICANTLLYENTENEYRKEINKNLKANSEAEADRSEQQKKYLKQFLIRDIDNDGYEIGTLKDYKVNETNFFEPKKPIVTSCLFEAKNVIFGYDKYVIVNVGSLIGNQLTYNQRDLIRQNDFNIPYKKKYTYSINIKIPEGYTVDDISDLNQRYESTAGSFITKAELKENVINLQTEKTYKFQNHNKNNAPEVLDFLNLANEFSKKKLLLRKI